MTDDLVPARGLLGLLFRLLYQEHSGAVDQALSAAGFGDIRLPHANVFPFVPVEGIQVAELAFLAGVRKQTMAQAVGELEQMGYVERRRDPGDGRAKLVLLTARGKAVRPVAVAAGRQVEEHWARLVGEGDLEQLRGGLQRLLERLREERAGTSERR